MLQTTPENFDDVWRVAVGANYRVNDRWMVRAGSHSSVAGNDVDRTPRLPDSTHWSPSVPNKHSKDLIVDAGFTYIIVEDSTINTNAGSTAQYGLLRGNYDSNVVIFSIQAALPLGRIGRRCNPHSALADWELRRKLETTPQAARTRFLAQANALRRAAGVSRPRVFRRTVHVRSVRCRPRAAVLGAGVMGAQIAAHLSNAGVPVVLYDLAAKDGDPDGIVRKALAGLAKLEPAPLAAKDRAAGIEAANYDRDLARLAECDLVIEAIAERVDWKRELYAKVAPHLASHAVLATNTSGLSLATLSEALPDGVRPRFCGVHFFNPAYMHLVELVPGPRPSPGCSMPRASHHDARKA